MSVKKLTGPGALKILVLKHVIFMLRLYRSDFVNCTYGDFSVLIEVIVLSFMMEQILMYAGKKCRY
jgi:hypothetical protein